MAAQPQTAISSNSAVIRDDQITKTVNLEKVIIDQSVVNADKTQKQQGQQNQKKQADVRKAASESNIIDLKAILAVDKITEQVVVRVLDDKGKTVRQYPPEEYLHMVKKFRDNVEMLFSKKV